MQLAERSNDSSTVRISLPFEDQVAANAVRKELRNLSNKIGPTLQPVFREQEVGARSWAQRNQAVNNCE